MAPRWIHELFDILTFGRSYWWVHKKEDEASKYLGVEHRKVEHEFYQTFRNSNSNVFLSRIPELLFTLRNEEEGVKLIHSLIDKVWDELSLEQRKGSVAVFRRLILEGKIECEPCHEENCQKLTNYVRDKTIRDLL